MTEFIILVLNIKLEVKIISFEENVFFKITLLNFAPQNYKFSHFNHTYSPKRNPTKAKPTKTIVRSNTQHWDKNSSKKELKLSKTKNGLFRTALTTPASPKTASKEAEP